MVSLEFIFWVWCLIRLCVCCCWSKLFKHSLAARSHEWVHISQQRGVLTEVVMSSATQSLHTGCKVSMSPTYQECLTWFPIGPVCHQMGQNLGFLKIYFLSILCRYQMEQIKEFLRSVLYPFLLTEQKTDLKKSQICPIWLPIWSI